MANSEDPTPKELQELISNLASAVDLMLNLLNNIVPLVHQHSQSIDSLLTQTSEIETIVLDSIDDVKNALGIKTKPKLREIKNCQKKECIATVLKFKQREGENHGQDK